MVNLFLKKDKPNEFNHSTMETALKLIWGQGGRIQQDTTPAQRKWQVWEEKKKSVSSLGTETFVWDKYPVYGCIYLRGFISISAISQNKSLMLTQGSHGWKENLSLAFSCSRTQHFGLLYKMSLSNSLLFWDFVQKDI